MEKEQYVIDFYLFGLLRETEAEIMLLSSSEALCSLHMLACQLHCYCATVNVPLYKTDTGRVSFLCNAPSRFS